MLESTAPHSLRPTWGQEVTVKMQCVLEDRTVVEKDCKLVFVIGEGDVNQVKAFNPKPNPFLEQGSFLQCRARIYITSNFISAQKRL